MNEYLSFNGLYTRKQFWLATLMSYVVMILAATGLGMSILTTSGTDVSPVGSVVAIFFAIAAVIVMILSLVGVWAALAKRTRDTGNSAWLCLLTAIPYVGIVPFLYFGLTSKSITRGTIQ